MVRMKQLCPTCQIVRGKEVVRNRPVKLPELKWLRLEESQPTPATTRDQNELETRYLAADLCPTST